MKGEDLFVCCWWMNQNTSNTSSLIFLLVSINPSASASSLGKWGREQLHEHFKIQNIDKMWHYGSVQNAETFFDLVGPTNYQEKIHDGFLSRAVSGMEKAPVRKGCNALLKMPSRSISIKSQCTLLSMILVSCWMYQYCLQYSRSQKPHYRMWCQIFKCFSLIFNGICRKSGTVLVFIFWVKCLRQALAFRWAMLSLLENLISLY
jgi:hypothetical protein